jgi:hypothetical protein
MIQARYFSPSVNLVRDATSNLDYIPTPNAKRVYQQILDNYALGTRSFNIIGSYGTGKSAFLLAVESTLSKKASFFDSPNGHFPGIDNFEFINVVGSYTSITEAFFTLFRVKGEKQFWSQLNRQHQQALDNNTCLVIVVDELGKYLEYAAQTNPEKELYFVQELAEYVNDPTKNILFLTTLHQNFFTYSAGLTRKQQVEWEKVKGRLKELTFNEPVDQLLELAANHIGVPQGDIPTTENISSLVDAINRSNAYPLRTKLTSEFAQQILPLDILSASILVQALQRYGQNERSLFTFLNSDEYLGLRQYDTSKNPYYNISCVFDYLSYNYSSLLTTVHNPHYTGWGKIRKAIERTESTVAGGVDSETIIQAISLVKTIGLIDIFAPDGARIDDEFLDQYASLALNIPDARPIVEELKKHKIIKYASFRSKYRLFEGTDLDIEHALVEAAGSVSAVDDVVGSLKNYFEFPYMMAKAVSYKSGTPRFFEFRLTEEPITESPEGITDGFVNLVFGGSPDDEEFFAHSAENVQTLYGWYRNANQIRELILEIGKIDYVRDHNQDDDAAVAELKELKQVQEKALNEAVMDSLYADNGSVQWIWNGQVRKARSATEFNSLLSAICKYAYSQTPIYRSELVNRHSLSSAIATARRYFIQALVDNWDQEDIGFPKDKFPAQKSIYLTLLKRTGIHRKVDGLYSLEAPVDESFLPLWEQCEQFVAETAHAPKLLSDLVELLLERPFKLKQGFVDFWLPTFLFAKREDFALYHDGRFIPSLSVDTFDLIRKDPSQFKLKAFNVEGVKQQFFNRCRELLLQKSGEQITTTSFIDTIRPLIVFYNGLSSYAKNTTRLDSVTIRLREAISKSVDPEKTFFEDFPNALGFKNIDQDDISDEEIEQYVTQLKESVYELQTCYDNLIDRVEAQIREVLGDSDHEFPLYRDVISQRFAELRTHLLLPRQKALYARLTSAIDDREAWLNSVAQAVLKKPMQSMRDEDELILYDKFRAAIQELDNLCELAQTEDDESSSAVRVEITTTASGSRSHVQRKLSKRREDEAETLYMRLSKQLDIDPAIRMSVLLRLLQETIDDE